MSTNNTTLASLAASTATALKTAKPETTKKASAMIAITVNIKREHKDKINEIANKTSTNIGTLQDAIVQAAMEDFFSRIN